MGVPSLSYGCTTTELWVCPKLTNKAIPLVVCVRPPENHDDEEDHREQQMPERLVHPQLLPVLRTKHTSMNVYVCMCLYICMCASIHTHIHPPTVIIIFTEQTFLR